MLSFYQRAQNSMSIIHLCVIKSVNINQEIKVFQINNFWAKYHWIIADIDVLSLQSKCYFKPLQLEEGLSLAIWQLYLGLWVIYSRSKCCSPVFAIFILFTTVKKCVMTALCCSGFGLHKYQISTTALRHCMLCLGLREHAGNDKVRDYWPPFWQRSLHYAGLGEPVGCSFLIKLDPWILHLAGHYFLSYVISRWRN